MSLFHRPFRQRLLALGTATALVGAGAALGLGAGPA